MIIVTWQHQAAQSNPFHSLLPKAIESIDRWASVDGNMDEDEYGIHYDIHIREGIKWPGNQQHRVLRPATLRLGAQKALQDAPQLWAGWGAALMLIFANVAGSKLQDNQFFDPDHWTPQTLDLMVQLAWFREVMFA